MYLIDANVFIEAKNVYYRFDTFPGFWEWLDREQAKGQIRSIQPICDELLKGNDDLATWIKKRNNSDWFLAVDDIKTQQNLQQIAGWVMSQAFRDVAKADFLSGGDPWLIAKAMSMGATVVTQETFDSQSKKKVKIPNVCRVFQVPYINIFDLLRQTGATFTLQEAKT
jgi:predicted nucleic acid-binding protein